MTTALEGMRILDASQYEAGPSCTQALAWLGADVVKIERPGAGDPGRTLLRDLWEDSEYFINWNSNKRSVAIDLSRTEGRDLLLRMAPLYDVFVENFGPGVIEKLKLDYEVLKTANPAIIYAQIKGFGTSGPYARYKSFDIVAQATAGALSITGNPDGPPTRPGPTTGDAGSGVQMALAITAAYVQKMRTGEGQLIELSMQEAMTYFMRTMIAMGAKWGERVAERRGNGIDATINMFPCSPGGANDYVYLMAVTEPMFCALCRVLGKPELAEDERYRDGATRRENADALIEEITAWTRKRTKHEAMRELNEGGVPAGAVFDTRDLFADPHLNERGFIKTVEHPTLGPIRLLGAPIQMSASSTELKCAPLLGEHTAEVLAEDLNLAGDDLKALREAGAIGGADGEGPTAR